MGINPQIRRGEAQHIQIVRFMQPPIKLRRLAVGAAVSFGCYFTYQSLVFAPLARFREELEKDMDEKRKKELEKAREEDGGSWFIPFPWTERSKAPLPFVPSDPEWSEYVKFHKNPQVGTMVRDELAELVRYTCQKNSECARKLGKNMKVSRKWVDIEYPLYPPKSWERSGLEITNEHIAWVTVPVDSETVYRIRRALWPSVYLQASMAFVKVQFGRTLSRVSEVSGVKPKPKPTFEELVALKKARPTTTPQGAGNGEMSAVPTTQTPDPRGATDSKASSTPSTKPTEEESTDRGLVISSFSRVQDHMSDARQAFDAKWVRVFARPRTDPSRGSIHLFGLVEVEGDRGYTTVDIDAYYDPKTKAFNMGTLRFHMRGSIRLKSKAAERR